MKLYLAHDHSAGHLGHEIGIFSTWENAKQALIATGSVSSRNTDWDWFIRPLELDRWYPEGIIHHPQWRLLAEIDEQERKVGKEQPSG